MTLAPFFGDLATQPLFVVYQLRPKADGSERTDKVPVGPYDQLRDIDCHEAANRMPLAEAELWAGQLGASYGVGYVLTVEARTFFLDLDHVREGDGWRAFVGPTVALFPGAYVECSSSGDGIHVLGRYSGDRPLHRTRCKEIHAEIYTAGRFCALTGSFGVGSILSDHTAALTTFLAERFPPRGDGDEHGDGWTTEAKPGFGIADDERLVERALRSQTAASVFGGKASFADLWACNVVKLGAAYPSITGQPYDGSAADMALSNHLAFWSGGNCDQVARLLKASGLSRGKHEREAYIESTVLRACSGTTSWYAERSEFTAAAPDAVSNENAPTVASADFAFDPDDPMPNARLFVATQYAHAEHSLLVHQGGSFYGYDGASWPVFEDAELRAELYTFFERRAYPALKGPQSFKPNRNKIANLVDSLQAVTLLPVRTAAPSWLSPCALAANELIACESGLIHWPTRTLHAHTPTFYVHHSVPFAFDPAALSPARWIAFLRELWGEDQESIDCLQEWFGYLISGATNLQKMLLMVGPRRGGKGTIARVLKNLIGEHNVVGPTLASFSGTFGLMPLIGKPVAIISDARLGSDSSNGSIVTERLLSISGEDMLTIDRKNRDHWSGQLPTRIVVLSNELPKFNDTSGALPSRFIMLHLSQSFYGRENPNLTAELVSELPGIFNWALDGLVRLRARDRFVQPATSADEMTALEDLASPIGAFVRDRCELGPECAITCSELYSEYRGWCVPRGHIPTTAENFGSGLRAVDASIQRRRPRTDGARTYVYAGVGLSGPSGPTTNP